MSEPIADFDPLEAIADEIAARCRRGERPAPAEYATRYPELAERIAELFPVLVMMEDLGSVAGAPSGSTAGADGEPAPLPVPAQLGDFRIVRVVGRGGMGVVYEAVQNSLERHVALKVLPAAALLPRTHLERFRREARAAARLHHSNIVPVYGVGDDQGIHYYAMQFIQGQGLDDVLRELRRLRSGRPAAPRIGHGPPDAADGSIAASLLSGRWEAARDAAPLPEPAGDAPPGDAPAGDAPPGDAPPGDAPAGDAPALSDTLAGRPGPYFRSVAHMGAQVADALAYAHKQGIVHRDIKPSNLLLDGRGTVWVTDFGLAKATGTNELTEAGDIVGTLRYMAPERFAGRSDARSDVYALGMTLYEMLTLQPAFGASQRPRLIDQVLHDDPACPRRIDPQVPRDLETIVLKAIDKSPGRRYATAEEVGADLRRYLAGEPLRARRTGPLERGVKWVRRRPTAAALLAVIALAGLAAAIGSLSYNARLEQALNEAETNLDRAVQAERQQTEQLGLSYLRQAQASRWSGRAGQRVDGLEALRHAAANFRALGTLDQHVLELRNAAIASMALAELAPGQELRLQPPWTRFLGFHGGGRLYALGDDDGHGSQRWISLRRTNDHQEVVRLPGPGVYAHTVGLSPDERCLAAIYHRDDQSHKAQFWVWDLQQAEPVLKEDMGFSRGFDFTPDGARLAACLADRSIRIYDLPAARETARFAAPYHADTLRFRPDGRAMVLVGTQVNHRVTVVGTANGEVLTTLPHASAANGAAWRGDGRLLAVGCDDHRAYVYDLADAGKPLLIHTLRGHRGQVTVLAFNHGGDVLATTGWDGTTRLWDPLTGQQLVATEGGTGTWFGAGDRVLGYKQGHEAFGLWTLSLARERRTFHGHRGAIWSAQIAADGRLMVSAGDDGVRFWDLDAPTEYGKEIASLYVPGPARAALLQDDALITAGAAGVRRWPLWTDFSHGGVRRGSPQRLGPAAQAARPVNQGASLSPDGRRMAVVASVGRAFVFDLDAPEPLVWLQGHAGLADVVFSPNGQWLASGTWRSPSGVRIWDAATGALLRDLPSLPSAHVAFSPDGRYLVTGSGQEFQFHEVDSWRLVRRLPRERAGSMPGVMVFTRRGDMLAVEHSRTLVRLLDPATGNELATLPAAGRPLAFSPDGSHLATVGENYTIDVWDLRLIRQQLAAAGLDWEPAAPAPSRAE
jgi:eukaryotic-like serine/threonine-protein kinase